jgi:hypothetical protein
LLELDDPTVHELAMRLAAAVHSGRQRELRENPVLDFQRGDLPDVTAWHGVAHGILTALIECVSNVQSGGHEWLN